MEVEYVSSFSHFLVNLALDLHHSIIWRFSGEKRIKVIQSAKSHGVSGFLVCAADVGQ